MIFSLLQTLRDCPLVFVDVETTGASVEYGHRICEMGIARVEGGEIVTRYEQLIDPQRRIGAGVTALTGISNEMVVGMPTFAQAAERMLELLSGAIVVGHNVRFDLSFMHREFRRAGFDLAGRVGDVPVLDTVRIARRRFGRGGNGLQRLCRRLGYEPAVAHRALADVLTTHAVFERMLEPTGGWGMTLADTLVAQGGLMPLVPPAAESLLPLELEEALDQRKPVMMCYLDANDSRTERVVQPLHIRKMKGELMLVAHCELRGAQRTFKVERIVEMKRVEGRDEG